MLIEELKGIKGELKVFLIGKFQQLVFCPCREMKQRTIDIIFFKIIENKRLVPLEYSFTWIQTMVLAP